MVTIEGVLRMIAAGTAFDADMWRKFIGEGPGRALPELESMRPNVGSGQNTTFLRQWWARIQAEVAAGNMAALVAEAESSLANGGWTSGDLKLLYKVIAHNSQLNIFLSAVAAAKVNEKNITDAIGKNFGVYSEWNQHFERWGQTWGTIVQSFLGLVDLVNKIKEGSLEALDVWKYRDEAFQATFDKLEDQQYLRDLEAWDPDELALFHPKDLAGNRPPGEPLFWSELLALYMTEEVFGGVIVITKDNFLRHKDLAEEVRTKQKAIRRALHVVEHYVDQPQRTSLLPDVRPAALAGIIPGALVGMVLASFAGLPMDKGTSFRPVGLFAVMGWWTESQLRRRLGVVESFITHIAVAILSLEAYFVVGSAKDAQLRSRGVITAAQTVWRILTNLSLVCGATLLAAVVLFFLVYKGRRE